MNHRRGTGCVFGLGIVSLVLLSGCGKTSPEHRPGSGIGPPTAPNGSLQIVHVVASDFRWTMGKTVFSAGQPIEFEVGSKQGTHGFSIDGTSVNKIVPQGQTVDIIWNAPKPGKYTIRCDVYCGSGHDKMFTSFTVNKGSKH